MSDDIEYLTQAAALADWVLPTATAEIIANELYVAADFAASVGRINSSRMLCAREVMEMVEKKRREAL